MRLMREITEDGSCKYALLRLDRLSADQRKSVLDTLSAGMADGGFTHVKIGDVVVPVEVGAKGSTEEFFVVKLKDRNSAAALYTYANSIAEADTEFSRDVLALADRAGSRLDSREPD